MLADELGESRGSAKVYMQRLRASVDRLLRAGKIFLNSEDIFGTERRPGGFVHSSRATVVFAEGEQSGHETRLMDLLFASSS